MTAERDALIQANLAAEKYLSPVWIPHLSFPAASLIEGVF
jgi:hypothetical protein